MTPQVPELIVWDFDGVLNRNIVDGRFVWTDRLEADFGIAPMALADGLFASNRMQPVMTGAADFRDVLEAWLRESGHAADVDALLDYWFVKDAHPDPEVLSWLGAHPAHHVIGTNNERRRAQYIADQMGMADIVDRIFASGEMGIAKPDPAYFEVIQNWSGLPPARIMLVDDTAENVAAAITIGWQGFHFTDHSRAGLPDAIGLAR